MGERLDGTQITEALVRRVETGSNWVERRDAATALTMMVREGLLALRKTAEDRDPDVAHECRKAVDTVQNDLKGALQDIEQELGQALRAYRADLAGSQPGDPDAIAEGESPEAGGEKESPARVWSHQATRDDLERWVRQIADSRRGDLREAEGQWKLEFALEGERRQTVFIDPSRKDSAGQDVAVMYTLCGPAEPQVYAKALKTNMQLSHAAFGIVDQKDSTLLALISRRRIGELTRDSLEETLVYLAKKGDRAESQLHADDAH